MMMLFTDKSIIIVYMYVSLWCFELSLAAALIFFLTGSISVR